jgi:hypothetical protein
LSGGTEENIITTNLSQNSTYVFLLRLEPRNTILSQFIPTASDSVTGIALSGADKDIY